jgi:hypothetical protein
MHANCANLASIMPDNEELTTGTTGASQLAEAPQFATAEYAHIPGTERCRICNNLVSGEYYRVNNQIACAKCATEAREGQPADSHSAFARGLLLGIGGAILGLILYSTVGIVSGYTIGYVALAVGWLVGKGIIKGSNGMGGRRYQIAAVALTYVAISLSAIPIGISYAIKHEAPHHSAPASSANSTAPEGQSETQTSTSEPTKKINWGAFLGQMALLGLASPFLELQDPVHGVIGLFILFIGLSIAFRLTAAKPLEVDGPYNAAS